MKPILRGHLHQAMFFIALGALVPLIFEAKPGKERLAFIIYAISNIAMFGISAIYHRVNWSPEKRKIWKKLDHAGIYIMIAGCFTPVGLLVLSEESGTKVLLTIWILAIIGILQSLFFVHLPKYVSAAIYLFAGFQITPYLSELFANIGMTNVILVLAGGLAYTIGAICYGFKWPKINPKWFGYHELFHLLVNIGATLHFIFICSLIKN